MQYTYDIIFNYTLETYSILLISLPKFNKNKIKCEKKRRQNFVIARMLLERVKV